MLPTIRERVLPKSMIFSDEARFYDPLTRMGYGHQRVAHAAHVYVSGDAHTNTIEGFCLMRSLGGSRRRFTLPRSLFQSTKEFLAADWRDWNVSISTFRFDGRIIIP